MMDMPERLAARPFDRKRKLPIPYVNDAGDGVHDFTVVIAEKGYEVGTSRRCGLCGQQLDYWIAFLGGPSTVTNRLYTDPPMHVDCAKASLRLCPYIARRNMKRVPEERTAGHALTPAGFVDAHPEAYVLYITRDYKVVRLPQPDGEFAVGFRPAAPKELLTYRYDDAGYLIL